MYSIENKTEESRVIQNNAEKHIPTAHFKDNRFQNETERSTTAQLEKKENLTGMPDNLKEGIESLSGFSMDDVRVHYNSDKPATVQALAYTQGTDIHVAPGQEKCLPHEAWHVVQQMAGRVSPTTNINGMPVNDNAALEHEADVMGEKAVQCKEVGKQRNVCLMETCCQFSKGTLQCNPQNMFDFILTCPKFDSMQDLWTKCKDDENLPPFVKKGVLRLNQFFANKNIFVDFTSKTEYDKDKLILLICNAAQNYKNLDSSDKKKAEKANNDIKVLKMFLGYIESDCYYIKQGGDSMGKNADSNGDEKSVETVVNSTLSKCVNILSYIALDLMKGKSADYWAIPLRKYLTDLMICYEEGRHDITKNIFEFVKSQVEMYDGFPAKQLSVMILGVARHISYILNDPWAENRLARLLNNKIEEKIGKEFGLKQISENKCFFNSVRAFARSNPLLMYLNKELNEQDACHLIHIRAVRAYGIDDQEHYNEMYENLRKNAIFTIISMCKSGALLTDGNSFSPSTLGMFRLYGEKKEFESYEAFDEFLIKLKNFKVETDRGFIGAYDKQWRTNAESNSKEELKNELNEQQRDEYTRIITKLSVAPITIRLHSSDLKFQDGKKFYHAKPWFSSVNIGGEKIPYHPASGRDGHSHYSLWRTYKDHFYRGMLWKRGKDGLSVKGVDSQSIDAGGAIQQSFGALNFNFEQNCYGLLCDYNYGNVSLVLNDSIKKNCIYTIGDRGFAYSNLESVACVLARLPSDIVGYGEAAQHFLNIAGKYNDHIKKVKMAILDGCAGFNEALEVQIFQDIKFWEKSDIKEIHCVGVKENSNEFRCLLAMVGGDPSKVHCH